MSDGKPVVILGAGMAGLTLARHLLVDTDRRVLLLDPRDVPGPYQKVGESTVQIAAYYLARVLDLQDVLVADHFMKYNLRYYWKSAGRANDALEDYSQVFLSTLSNIACYQIDRNHFEGTLLALNRSDPRCEVVAPAGRIDVTLGEGSPHRVTFTDGGAHRAVEADWVVDASGLAKLFQKQLALGAPGRIRHGATWFWVDGLVDIERCSDRSIRERRLKPERSWQGHLPLCLATNHFCGPGYWVWVITIRDRTSFGIVYDRASFPDEERIQTGEAARQWIMETFPLLGRELAHRPVVDWGRNPDFANDCRETLSAQGWAITGIAGRFLDPLYSGGSDLISLHNTLIVDSVRHPERCADHARTLRTVYAAYVPGYQTGYAALGDGEAFALKYTFDLSVYFACLVYPFVNDALTDPAFAAGWLEQMERLGAVNHNLQSFLGDFARWKQAPREPRYLDLETLGPLMDAQRLFLDVGRAPSENLSAVRAAVDQIITFARFILAHVHAVVLDEPAAATDRSLVESIDVEGCPFDPDAMKARWEACGGAAGSFSWPFRTHVMAAFRRERTAPQGQESSQERPNSRLIAT